MAPPKIYLETTMFSFYYETREDPHYHAMREIDDEPDLEKRERMAALIADYGVKFLEDTPEVKRLAALYIEEGAVPAASKTAAAHIAITAINGLDFIVSLNFGHIARSWTIERVRRVNVRENLRGIGIYRPLEVLESEDDTGLYD